MTLKYPFKKNSWADLFCHISNVDWKTGYSKEISVEALKRFGFPFGNGGSWCRTDGPLGKQFNITRTKTKGAISSVKLDGFNKKYKSQNISCEIKNKFKNDRCVVLNIGGQFIEIDHKDGRKDDIIVDIVQDINDFQPLHKTVNVAKRDHCIKCIESNIRFDATLLGYSHSQWIGPTEYKGSCLGCYWYDPFRFNVEISKHFTKEM